MTTKNAQPRANGSGMTFMTVAEILGLTRRYHIDLRLKLTTSSWIISPRATLLRSWVADQEGRIDALLADYALRVRRELLITHIKYVPEIDVLGPLQASRPEQAASPDEMMQELLVASAGLCALLDGLSTQAPTQTTRELFSWLATQERELNKRYQRQALAARDL